MPNAKNVEEPLILSASMDEQQQPYESRHLFGTNKYYFVTNVTSIVNGVTVATDTTTLSINVDGNCLPACLELVNLCP